MNWATELQDSMLAPVTLKIGKRYVHPQDGVIEITEGCYRDATFGRVSNFWRWTVVETGEHKHGYGANWPEVKGDNMEREQDDQQLAAKDQMYFDADATHGYDSFLPEVIGILRVNHISFDIANDGSRSPERKVRVEFRGSNDAIAHLRLVMFGRSYGECLRKIREEIRIRVGR